MTAQKDIENTEDSNAVSVESTALLAVLSSWGDLAHDGTKGFCQRFCPKAWILTQVSWDSENMRFVYILDCGQHVADSVKITEWLEFLSANIQGEAQPSHQKTMNTPNDPKGAAGALKTPLALIPPFAMEQTAWVHRLGAEKYGPYNWRETGVCATTYVAAIMRHLNAWRDGEDLDPESGISHIAHIAAGCNIILDSQHCGTLQDDRYRKSDGFRPTWYL